MINDHCGVGMGTGISYHEGSKVGSEIQCVIGTAFMKKHDIGDDLGLGGLVKKRRNQTTDRQT